MGNTFSIVDFFLPDYATVVEIDGGYHNTTEQSAKDKARTRELLKRHVNIVRVVRFKNEELSLGTDYVLRKMARAIIPWIKWEL
jgi:very-short-patch-repair endonuclease